MRVRDEVQVASFVGQQLCEPISQVFERGKKVFLECMRTLPTNHCLVDCGVVDDFVVTLQGWGLPFGSGRKHKTSEAFKLQLQLQPSHKELESVRLLGSNIGLPNFSNQ